MFNRAAIDENSNVYIAGAAYPGVTFDGYTITNSLNPHSSVAFIISVDSNGNLRWGSHSDVADDATAGAMGIAYTNNTVNVVGHYGGELNWDSLSVTGPTFIGSPPKYIYLARFNATTGNILGLDSIPSNDFNTGASFITSDKNSNLYVGGNFAGALYPGNDTLYNMGGPYDWFVAKFGSANCNCTIPQPSFNYNNSGNSYTFNYTGSTPYTTISWDFGDGTPASNTNNPTHTYASSGSYNVCVTVTNDCGSNTTCQSINNNGTGIKDVPAFANINIYPNPATQEIMIDNAASGTILDIYNTTGSLVLHTKLKGTKDNIDVSGLSSGIYLMRFTDKEGRQGNSKFVKQ